VLQRGGGDALHRRRQPRPRVPDARRPLVNGQAHGFR
jgi:hypothetical protein